MDFDSADTVANASCRVTNEQKKSNNLYRHFRAITMKQQLVVQYQFYRDDEKRKAYKETAHNCIHDVYPPTLHHKVGKETLFITHFRLSFFLFRMSILLRHDPLVYYSKEENRELV